MQNDDEHAATAAARMNPMRLLTDPLFLDSFEMFMEHIDPNHQREGLRETPQRFLKAWAHWTSGHKVNVTGLLKTFGDGAERYDEMVFVGAIPFYSTCEHHLATFFGVAHVAYIPTDRVVGLSKIPRLVDAFARRLTVQERITVQVADALDTVLRPKGVGVVLQARHMCMESRGVNKPGAITTTCALRGGLKNSADARSEFMQMVANATKGGGIG